jgi:hypothetical protein
MGQFAMESVALNLDGYAAQTTSSVLLTSSVALIILSISNTWKNWIKTRSALESYAQVGVVRDQILSAALTASTVSNIPSCVLLLTKSESWSNLHHRNPNPKPQKSRVWTSF